MKQMKNPNRTARENRRADGGDSTDTIVVCAGKHGTSLQYGKWLMEELDCDGMGFDKRMLGYVSMYKNVVYIGAVRNGDIHMLNMLWQNYNNFGLEGRNLLDILVAVLLCRLHCRTDAEALGLVAADEIHVTGNDIVHISS
jgi:hypothetical protein